MNNSEIKKILRGLGLYWGAMDETYSDKLKQAVLRFQRIHPPLVCDGIVGKNTIRELQVDTFWSRDKQNNGIHEYPNQSDVRDFYGAIGSNMKKVRLPYVMRLAWDLPTRITKFTCHGKIVKPLSDIFMETLDHYGLYEINRLGLDLFGGCFNIRKMRGGSRHSMHSWGIAVDLDPARNQLRWGRDRAHFARKDYEPFWDIVEKHGATSIGREKDYDWMHFQFARL
jgi:hypothetical protein